MVIQTQTRKQQQKQIFFLLPLFLTIFGVFCPAELSTTLNLRFCKSSKFFILQYITSAVLFSLTIAYQGANTGIDFTVYHWCSFIFINHSIQWVNTGIDFWWQ